MNHLRLTLENKNGSSLDLWWHSAHFFHNHQPSWSGLYAISNYWNILRKISHNISSNCWYQCINLRAIFLCYSKPAAKLNIDTPRIILDQPLYIQAFEITKSQQMNTVISLRGVHLLMSFLRSIGSVMESSELKNDLERLRCTGNIWAYADWSSIFKDIKRKFFSRVNDICKNFIKRYPWRFSHCKLSNLRSKQNEWNEKNRKWNSKQNGWNRK